MPESQPQDAAPPPSTIPAGFRSGRGVQAELALPVPAEEQAKPADGAEAPDDAIDPGLARPRGGEEVAAVLEALLFSAPQPLSAERIGLLMNGVPVEEVREALDALAHRYRVAASGLMLQEVAGGWQLSTRPEVSDWVLRLHKHRKKNPLTPALMESLAIVAYKQPITRSEIEAIRGVDCSTAMRALQDAGLIEIIGRKEVIGRPPIYGTSDTFLKVFGLRDLAELPSLRDFQQTAAATAAAPPAAS